MFKQHQKLIICLIIVSSLFLVRSAHAASLYISSNNENFCWSVDGLGDGCGSASGNVPAGCYNGSITSGPPGWHLVSASGNPQCAPGGGWDVTWEPDSQPPPPPPPPPPATYHLSVTVSGSGDVTSNGYGTCHSFDPQPCGIGGIDIANGASVVLTANGTNGASFNGWGGDCAGWGTNSTCSGSMTQNYNVTAGFGSAALNGSITVTTNKQDQPYFLHRADGSTVDGWFGDHVWSGLTPGQYWFETFTPSGYSAPNVSPSSTVTVPSGGNINVTITYTKLPVTASITCNGSSSTTIPFNSSATLAWSSTQANTCSVSPGGWSGTSNSGQSTGNLISTQTYTLTCNR